MKVILKNYDTRKVIGTLQVKKLDRLFDVTQLISEEQQKTDFLGLGFTCEVTDAGITSYCSYGAVMSNDPEEVNGATVRHERGSTLIGASNVTIKEPVPVRIRKDERTQEISLRLFVTAFPEGYVLDVGKTSSNIFGVRSKMYLATIGTKNIRFGGLGNCHVFPTVKSVLGFVTKHRAVFNHMADNGYNFTVCPVCPQFAIDMNDVPEKDKKFLEPLSVLLNEINAYEVASEEDATLTGTATPEEMHQEAINRLTKLGVWDRVIEHFRKESKVFMSEFGGIVYDPNEDAKKAIAEVSGDSHLPYAVIRTQTTLGDMYCVLYVSSDKGNWERERADRHGYCEAYGYNATEPNFSEYGSAQIQQENGGLVRLC